MMQCFFRVDGDVRELDTGEGCTECHNVVCFQTVKTVISVLCILSQKNNLQKLSMKSQASDTLYKDRGSVSLSSG